MSKNLYLSTTEARSGKSAIALGLMELLNHDTDRLGFFRPIIHIEEDQNKPDNDIQLILANYNLKQSYDESYAYTSKEANELLTQGKQDELLDGILSKYKALEQKCDFVLCEGTDFEGVTSAYEFDINADIANNLGSPVFLVMNSLAKSPEEVVKATLMAVESFQEKGCTVMATVVNRVNKEEIEEVLKKLKEEEIKDPVQFYAIPDDPTLGNPTLEEIAKVLDADILYGDKHLHKHANHYLVAGMQLRNFLTHLKEGSLIIVPGDRADIILGSLLALQSNNFPNVAGMILTGGLVPDDSIASLLEGLSDFPVSILAVNEDTFHTTTILNSIHAAITPDDARKIASALEVFETYIPSYQLRNKIAITRSTKVTPKMFEFGLVQRAKANKMHIVLPEGNEERILRAAEVLLRRDVVDITLLGPEKEVRDKISKLGLKLEKANLIDPSKSKLLEEYSETYFEARKKKGITMENAHDAMLDVNYFGTMMIHKGHADGMVSGSVHTTQQTIRPSLEFVKTKPGFSIVSSVFFMCLEDRVLVYGDCAVNPNPDAEQLAEIAIASADTGKIFGIEPKIAMLSYSTGSSGKGADVDKIREATKIAQGKRPDLLLEGPLQYDAAVDIEVAKTKLPDSKVAGHATVFIFPDLNTGNNTYKAVQRSAPHTVAVGPVLQGLKKPVNDLSRGCTIPDIVNTVIITAIQAQAEKGIV